MKNVIVLVILSLALFSCKDKPSEVNEKIESFGEIDFRESNFESLLDMAAKENKLIFIDCYTSWCAPCKWMDKNIFVKQDVYEFYNKSFINAKIDMEKGEGPKLGKRFGVQSYPTYLFINSKGELVHKATSKMSAEEFINEGKNAIDPSKALGSLSEKYEEGVMTNEEMLDYLMALNQIRDSKTNQVYDKLLTNVDDSWLKSVLGWRLIEAFVYDDTHKLFKFLDDNKQHYIDLIGINVVNKVYKRALTRNIYRTSKNTDEKLFFEQLDSLKKLSETPRDVAIIHSSYYANTDNAEEFINTTNYYLDNYLQDDPETIAFIARSAAREDQKNMAILKQAAYIIDKAYKIDPDNYGTVGTYAQILSAIGEKEKAIELGEIAVKMADTISSKVKNRAMENLEAIKKAN
ncbi:thioredoxin fold domain-containing protein [Gelidibacter maritimus]|uniref:Thioredoxin family protein n=1 Tax=Gelidibacter maritimus TaxID=2761487 RepID=A0A7W2R4B3_9FLAO|nr:thioredoxin fold domain-containing protein [Gelidibacter maritimus]MBA6152905.1 thioredoxin family protein [Gelidibacter maritimus]